MKKIIPILAIIGGAAVYVAYKMKKDEQKHIVELDQGLLQDEDLDTSLDEVEEGPISEPKSFCMHDMKEGFQDTMSDMREDICECAKEQAETISYLVEEEIKDLENKASEIIEALRVEGDNHDHERPIQHTVYFTSQEDVDNFKNEVINKGFVITKGKTDEELTIIHITPLNESKLLKNILYIANAVKKNNGSYGGWASKVIY